MCGIGSTNIILGVGDVAEGSCGENGERRGGAFADVEDHAPLLVEERGGGLEDCGDGGER